MPIRREKAITRAMLRASPETLFVFGDNLQRKGLGGQAAEMRGEPNAVGIPTKRHPGMLPWCFFDDGDLDAYLEARIHDLYRLIKHLEADGLVIIPADGLGTGRARLAQTAPKVWAQLMDDMAALAAVAEDTPQARERRSRALDELGALDGETME